MSKPQPESQARPELRRPHSVEAPQAEISGPETTLAPHLDHLAQLIAGAGDNAPAHAAALNRITGGRLSRAGSTLLQLQRQYGNRHVQRVVALARSTAPRPAGVGIQTKLMVGPAGDEYEQEADRIAQRIMRMPLPNLRSHPPDAADDAGSAPKKLLVRRARLTDRFEAGSAVESRLARERSGGQPLPATTRAFMEPRFGSDFSGVRVHIDGEADSLNQALSARAFTTGQHIFFKRGDYQPGSASGRGLLAHELTHVVQQGAAGLSTGPESLLQRTIWKWRPGGGISGEWEYYSGRESKTPPDEEHLPWFDYYDDETDEHLTDLQLHRRDSAARGSSASTTPTRRQASRSRSRSRERRSRDNASPSSGRTRRSARATSRDDDDDRSRSRSRRRTRDEARDDEASSASSNAARVAALPSTVSAISTTSSASLALPSLPSPVFLPTPTASPSKKKKKKDPNSDYRRRRGRRRVRVTPSSAPDEKDAQGESTFSLAPPPSPSLYVLDAPAPITYHSLDELDVEVPALPPTPDPSSISSATTAPVSEATPPRAEEKRRGRKVRKASTRPRGTRRTAPRSSVSSASTASISTATPPRAESKAAPKRKRRRADDLDQSAIMTGPRWKRPVDPLSVLPRHFSGPDYTDEEIHSFAGGKSSTATLGPLSSRGMGSDADSSLPRAIEAARDRYAIGFKAGHLLNADFFGDGEDSSNLTILTPSANTSMTAFDNPIKNAVAELRRLYLLLSDNRVDISGITYGIAVTITVSDTKWGAYYPGNCIATDVTCRAAISGLASLDLTALGLTTAIRARIDALIAQANDAGDIDNRR